jgi:putative transposase
VERFNDTYNRKFFRRQWFPSYATLKKQAKHFQRFHNRHHRCSCLKGKTPDEVLQEHNFTPLVLGPNTKVPSLISIPGGRVMFIRFIRSDGKLNIFWERFVVSKELIYPT